MQLDSLFVCLFVLQSVHSFERPKRKPSWWLWRDSNQVHLLFQLEALLLQGSECYICRIF